MKLPLFVAKRYLFAKKSHNVINIISLISAIGIAVGTAALIIVLSVYNGFDNLVREIYSNIEADFVITSSNSKYFPPNADKMDRIRRVEGVKYIYEIVEDNAFVNYGNSQGIALVKGVDTSYTSQQNISKSIVEGDSNILHGEIAQAVVGRGLARELRINISFLDPIEVFFPKRNIDISLTNPISSLNKGVFFPTGIISLERETDKKLMVIPISNARSLFGYTNEVTSLEIIISNPKYYESIQRDISSILGEGFIVKNRIQQNETIYKMMTYEKIAIYMILLFIIVIVSCNVFGSLTMLIIEKKEDIITFKNIGASDSLIKRIFTFEGWFISLSGAIVGIIIGIALCLVQQYFGVIKMPGNFIVTSYPVIIQFSDIAITFVGVSIIGFILTSLPSIKTIPEIINNSEN
jgi:lipoprotein-releasing system permease protein